MKKIAITIMIGLAIMSCDSKIKESVILYQSDSLLAEKDAGYDTYQIVREHDSIFSFVFLDSKKELSSILDWAVESQDNESINIEDRILLRNDKNGFFYFFTDYNERLYITKQELISIKNNL